MEDVVIIEEDVLSTVVTWPNAVTAIRLALVPVYLWLVFSLHRYVPASILLACLGITDWVDGYLARRLNQTSTFGKILDPVADRILMITAVVSVAWVHAVPLWFAGLTLLREVLVSAAVLLLAALGAKRIDVLFVGKAGTFALMCSYPAFLIGHGPALWQTGFTIFAWTMGSVGLVLGWVALGSYIGPARKALSDGRRPQSTS